MKILTLIGNGFDLGHRLPTSFDNFIDSNPSVNKIKYAAFANGQNNWSDIEGEYARLLGDAMAHRSWLDVSEEVETILQNYGINESGEVNYYGYTSDAFEDELNQITKLIRLLSNFERDFLRYLKYHCNDETIKKCLPSQAINNILNASDRIITFNYTHTAELLYNATIISHVHGDIDSSIAIGSGALDNMKESMLDLEYPTFGKCRNKHDYAERLAFYVEDLEGNLHEDQRVKSFFNEVAESAQEAEEELFCLLDEKSKDQLSTRKRLISQLQVEHYDIVYIIGHSLNEADYSVFDAINKDAYVVCYYHSKNECAEKIRVLNRLGLKFELRPDRDLYA